MEDGNFQQIKLCFKADDQILNLLNNVTSLCNIIIETKSSDVDIEAYKQNQAQKRVVSIPLRSVNDVMIKLKQRIDTGRNVEGCCILSNGKKVFTHYSPGNFIIFELTLLVKIGADYLGNSKSNYKHDHELK